MKPKKPDRWERMVDKVLERDGTIYHHEVTDLLRNEHAWMRRIIKAQYKYDAPPGSVNFGYNQAVEFFLDQLKRRAK